MRTDVNGAGAETRLSAVVPCYREGESAPVMYERLAATFEALGVDWEIIFIDSGSPDDTPKVLAQLAARDRRVTIVHHTRAFGSQSAYSSGMRLATGDAVILLDGDLQDPPELIPELVARWREGYEVVYGERVKREGPTIMNATRKAFYRVFQRLAYVTMPIDAGDFSLIDRRAVDAINRLPETHRFVRGLRAFVGFRQIGVPYERPERLFGRSSNNMIANFGWARRAIISFSYVPLDLIGWLALVTTAASLVAAIVEIVLKIVDPGAAPKGYATLIVVVLFVGGIQLICFSVIGSYLAHMYEEVKARPPYILERVLNPPRTRDGDAAQRAELEGVEVRVVATESEPTRLPQDV
ncbi:MAG TPA: glycosyltransferase family 2 protein [Solirubrobacteraceae bacterium]|nr:glycosyltransferase family 2 protein [Solirubrobacteraceae bacterium]